MLELKNLSRTYQPKKGVPVQALKNINLTFDDKGMVFVLGKSGSGKSTLLNLIGGLDFADSGEIIIDGKSSKDFKERDYDSYRNTYIGFVFQEYNILNEFTVGENISLALELQSQKEDKERLESILKEVDLEGYADRKPNELSGGQKQRVAIARAIIKDPKIIMADEPTGALDSETGKAIFDTLKKLSQDRLVIVVSHDRDFAEQYGDRIIELADGEVISDETKNAQSQAIADKKENKQELKKSRLPYKRALAMGARTLRRKRGRLAITIILCFFSFVAFGLAVTAADFSRTDTEADLLSDMYQDGIVVLPSLVYNEIYKGIIQGASHNDLQKLREKTGIDFQGVLNSRNPRNYEYLVKIDDPESYYIGDVGGALPAKEEFFESQGYTLYGRMPENENEFVITKYIYDKMSLTGIKIENEDSEEKIIIEPEEFTDIQTFLDRNLYLTSPLTGQPTLVVGVVDTNFDPDGKFEAFKTEFEIDTNNSEMYHLLQEFYNYFYYGYYNLAFVYPQLYQEYDKVAATENSIDGIRDISGAMTLRKDIYGYGVDVNFNRIADEQVIREADKIIWIDGKGERRELANNEIIIGADIAIDGLFPTGNSYLQYKHPKTYFDGLVSLNGYVNDYDMRRYGAGEVALLEEAENISLQDLEKYKDYCREIGRVFTWSFSCFSADNNEENTNMETMQERDWRWSYAGYLYHPTVTEGGYYNNVTGRQSGEYIKNVLGDRWYLENRLTSAPNSAQRIDAKNFEINYDGVTYSHLSTVEFADAPIIVGVYFPKDGETADFLINNKMYQETECLEKTSYRFLIAPKTDDKSALKKLSALNCDLSQVRGFEVQNYGLDAVFDWEFNFKVLNPIIWVIAGVLGLFSILLMGSYIASSIKAQKKQIGMLRALGASKSDIFAIFANESAIIAGITLVLAVIGTLLTCIIFNAIISNVHSVTLNLLQFGIVEVILLALICIGVAVLASAIPLYKLSKKKPVDSIQDR